MTRTQTTIRMPESLIEELDKEAEARGVSRSKRVRQIIRERHESDNMSEEVNLLRDRFEQQQERLADLESKVEDLTDKDSEVTDAPFFVRWYQWFRELDQ